MENNIYYRQVKLLVQLLPLVVEESCFALKGGTANLKDSHGTLSHQNYRDLYTSDKG